VDPIRIYQTVIGIVNTGPQNLHFSKYTFLSITLYTVCQIVRNDKIAVLLVIYEQLGPNLRKARRYLFENCDLW
jgi:hypothetical protein